jgi:endonuclease-3
MNIDFIMRDLRERFPRHGEEIDEGTALARLEPDPFRILISTILSARTKDETTSAASNRLFQAYPTVADLAVADPAEVRELIYPVGFYKTKAERIVEVARAVKNDFGGEVPREMESLLQLPSVGRKTANCVLVYGFREDAIPVDTHVHRISNRLGLVDTKTPEQTERALVEAVPREHWLDLNELFVRFGQEVCKPIGPRCEECSFTSLCKHYLEVRA